MAGPGSRGTPFGVAKTPFAPSVAAPQARRSRRALVAERRTPTIPVALALLVAAACGGGARPPDDPLPPFVELGCGEPASAFVAYVSRATGSADIRVAAPDHLPRPCDVELTADAATDLAPSLSAAAHAVVFATVRDGGQRLVVHDLLTHAERVLDTGDLAAANPAFSPDGASIAFEGHVAGGNAQLHLVPLAGGAPRPVLEGASTDAGPAWSPDGARLFFTSNRSGRFQIWRVNADGTGAEQVSTDATAAVRCGAGACGVLGKPAVAPDGASIAFTRATAAQGSRVVIRDLATGAERVLADADDSEPTFDPTGGRIAVTSFAYGNPDVVIRDVADGAVLRRLTQAPEPEGAAAWAR
jgi:Tol biopolymer transport system component